MLGDLEFSCSGSSLLLLLPLDGRLLPEALTHAGGLAALSPGIILCLLDSILRRRDMVARVRQLRLGMSHCARRLGQLAVASGHCALHVADLSVDLVERARMDGVMDCAGDVAHNRRHGHDGRGHGGEEDAREAGQGFEEVALLAARFLDLALCFRAGPAEGIQGTLELLLAALGSGLLLLRLPKGPLRLRPLLALSHQLNLLVFKRLLRDDECLIGIFHVRAGRIRGQLRCSVGCSGSLLGISRIHELRVRLFQVLLCLSCRLTGLLGGCAGLLLHFRLHINGLLGVFQIRRGFLQRRHCRIQVLRLALDVCRSGALLGCGRKGRRFGLAKRRVLGRKFFLAFSKLRGVFSGGLARVLQAICRSPRFGLELNLALPQIVLERDQVLKAAHDARGRLGQRRILGDPASEIMQDLGGADDAAHGRDVGKGRRVFTGAPGELGDPVGLVQGVPPDVHQALRDDGDDRVDQTAGYAGNLVEQALHLRGLRQPVARYDGFHPSAEHPQLAYMRQLRNAFQRFGAAAHGPGCGAAVNLGSGGFGVVDDAGCDGEPLLEHRDTTAHEIREASGLRAGRWARRGGGLRGRGEGLHQVADGAGGVEPQRFGDAVVALHLSADGVGGADLNRVSSRGRSHQGPPRRSTGPVQGLSAGASSHPPSRPPAAAMAAPFTNEMRNALLRLDILADGDPAALREALDKAAAAIELVAVEGADPAIAHDTADSLDIAWLAGGLRARGFAWWRDTAKRAIELWKTTGAEGGRSLVTVTVHDDGETHNGVPLDLHAIIAAEPGTREAMGLGLRGALRYFATLNAADATQLPDGALNPPPFCPIAVREPVDDRSGGQRNQPPQGGQDQRHLPPQVQARRKATNVAALLIKDAFRCDIVPPHVTVEVSGPLLPFTTRRGPPSESAFDLDRVGLRVVRARGGNEFWNANARALKQWERARDQYASDGRLWARAQMHNFLRMFNYFDAHEAEVRREGEAVRDSELGFTEVALWCETHPRPVPVSQEVLGMEIKRLPPLRGDVVIGALTKPGESAKPGSKSIVAMIGVDNVLDVLLREVLDYTGADAEMPRGALLYGPPGTGKTHAMRGMCASLGIHLVSDPLSAADFARGYVGENAGMVRALATRAGLVPWRICAAAIDEIDGIAPSGATAEGAKSDLRGVILSHVGGVQDVPNFILIGGTNHLERMDPAFKRRTATQVYMGKPDNNGRRAWIDFQFLGRLPSLISGRRLVLDGDVLRTLFSTMVAWTLGFSHDQMRRAMTRLRLTLPQIVTGDEATARSVCRSLDLAHPNTRELLVSAVPKDVSDAIRDVARAVLATFAQTEKILFAGEVVPRMYPARGDLVSAGQQLVDHIKNHFLSTDFARLTGRILLDCTGLREAGNSRCILARVETLGCVGDIRAALAHAEALEFKQHWSLDDVAQARKLVRNPALWKRVEGDLRAADGGRLNGDLQQLLSQLSRLGEPVELLEKNPEEARNKAVTTLQGRPDLDPGEVAYWNDWIHSLVLSDVQRTESDKMKVSIVAFGSVLLNKVLQALRNKGLATDPPPRYTVDLRIPVDPASGVAARFTAQTLLQACIDAGVGHFSLLDRLSIGDGDDGAVSGAINATFAERLNTKSSVTLIDLDAAVQLHERFGDTRPITNAAVGPVTGAGDAPNVSHDLRRPGALDAVIGGMSDALDAAMRQPGRFKHVYCVVVRHPFLLHSLTRKTFWPESDKEREDRERFEERNRQQPKLCVRCLSQFKDRDNRRGACSIKDHALGCVLVNPGVKIELGPRRRQQPNQQPDSVATMAQVFGADSVTPGDDNTARILWLTDKPELLTRAEKACAQLFARHNSPSNVGPIELLLFRAGTILDLFNLYRLHGAPWQVVWLDGGSNAIGFEQSGTLPAMHVELNDHAMVPEALLEGPGWVPAVVPAAGVQGNVPAA